MKGKKFILFDFDGVIADSFEPAFRTARMMCARITDESYRKMFYGNAYEQHDLVMTADHGPECHHDLDWFSIFIPAFEETARLFDGIPGILERLSHEYVLIIVSSSVSSPIQGFLEKHQIGRYFSEIMGADVHTSKHKKIEMVFKKYDIVANDCVFITDTLGDIREAKAAGVGSIGVSWGFHPKETLMKGGPFVLVETPQGIPGAVGDYFAKSGGRNITES